MIRHLVEERQEEGLELFLRELLDANLADGKALAEDALYEAIAETSLYVLPSVIVHAWAAAVGRDFWDAWKGYCIGGMGRMR